MVWGPVSGTRGLRTTSGTRQRVIRGVVSQLALGNVEIKRCAILLERIRLLQSLAHVRLWNLPLATGWYRACDRVYPYGGNCTTCAQWVSTNVHTVRVTRAVRLGPSVAAIKLLIAGDHVGRVQRLDLLWCAVLEVVVASHRHVALGPARTLDVATTSLWRPDRSSHRITCIARCTVRVRAVASHDRVRLWPWHEGLGRTT